MKLSTHNVSGAAVALIIFMNMVYGHDTYSILLKIFISLILSAIVNSSIDFLYGHVGGRRTPWTHSVIGASILSLIISIAMIIVLEFIGITLRSYIYIVISIANFSIAILHIGLDALTAGGVYLLWPFSSKRYSLLKASYNDRVLNSLISLISIAIIMYVLVVR